MSIDINDDLFKLTGAAPAITPDATDLVPMEGIAERSIVVGGAVTPIIQVNGRYIGKAVGSLFMVWVAQLRLPDEILRKGYDPKQDAAFPGLMASIHQTGNCNVDPMICEPTDEVVEIDGEVRPVLIVRAGVRRFYALTELQSPEALVRVLPLDTDERMSTLVSLISNEMRQELSTLDQADVVALLTNDYGMKQHVIAGFTGYSQSKVSRLNTLSIQPPLLKTMVSNETLSLEDIYQLNRRFKSDAALRELAARYYVLEGKSITIDEIANQVEPPMGGSPTARLLLDGEVVSLIPLLPAPKKGASANNAALRLTPPPKPTYYWNRGFPLVAVPTRIVERHHPVRVTCPGPITEAKVTVASLHVNQLFEQFKKEREVDVAALEEAMLCDLEALREALEAKKAPTQSDEEDEEY